MTAQKAMQASTKSQIIVGVSFTPAPYYCASRSDRPIREEPKRGASSLDCPTSQPNAPTLVPRTGRDPASTSDRRTH